MLRRTLGFAFALFLTPALFLTGNAQDVRGRKYKPPPPTSHIEVMVLKGYNQKPIVNAAVVFHPVKDGKDIGTLEVKTDPDGKAVIDVIPTGSTVTLQVIADGFATHAEDFLLSDPSKEVLVRMIRPQAQISAYQDNRNKPADMAPGVQETPRKSTPPVVPPPQETNHTSDPAPLAPVGPPPAL